MQLKRRKRELLITGYFQLQKNDKRKAAENPLPPLGITIINPTLPLAHISNIPLPHTLWDLRVLVR